MRKAKGIGLLSGGLDSALATKVTMEAGAEVTCLYFFTGFSVSAHHSRVGKVDKPIADDALQVGTEIGVHVELVDVSQEYLNVALHPKHGYGANMNPCVDCREFMLIKAKEYMERVEADFVYTGEVIGQRPMSQMRDTLAAVERRTGLEGRLLRPLSAKLLPPTIVEREGLIDREKLFDIQGRSRKRQLELAEKYGITKYMQPSGGCCFLTDEAYSRKFKDLIENLGEEAISVEDIYLLGVGRHFRLSPSLKVIIGRDQIENNFLSRFSTRYWSARVREFPGPTALIMGEIDDGSWKRIAAMTARYSDGKHEPSVIVEFSFGDRSKVLIAAAASDTVLDTLRI